MNGNPTLRRANAGELSRFYDWMKKQFHAGELKPLWLLEQLSERGLYAAYGLWDAETLLAYALVANTADGRMCLLDYYAVLPEHQDAGWGSRFLQMLREELSGDVLLLEVEDPAYAPDAEEAAHCSRRIRFYERNGCLHTRLELVLFGFDYVIMKLPLNGEVDDVTAKTSLKEIYRAFFPPEAYAENVRFRDEK